MHNLKDFEVVFLSKSHIQSSSPVIPVCSLCQKILLLLTPVAVWKKFIYIQAVSIYFLCVQKLFAPYPYFLFKLKIKFLEISSEFLFSVELFFFQSALIACHDFPK